jgi:hypothetical protein
MITATVRATIDQHIDELLALSNATNIYLKALEDFARLEDKIPDDGTSDWDLPGLANQCAHAIQGRADGTPGSIADWLTHLLKPE